MLVRIYGCDNWKCYLMQLVVKARNVLNFPKGGKFSKVRENGHTSDQVQIVRS